MSAPLRIRPARRVVAPDTVSARDLDACRVPRPIEADAFFDACQRVPNVETTDDDAIAVAVRREERVRVELVQGEVRFSSSPRWVARLAIALARHLRGTVSDTLGASYFGDEVARTVAQISVQPEWDVDGQRLPLDFAETSLLVGWSPVRVRDRVVSHVFADDADVHAVVRREQLWVTWTGHPMGRQVVCILSDEGVLRVDGPDLATARWLVDVARRVGSVCTDIHGLVWVADDGPDGIAPLWPEPHDDADSTVHHLLRVRARRAFNIEAALDGAETDETPVVEHDLGWWQRMIERSSLQSVE